MRFIGVDLHSNQLTACYLTSSGRETHRTFSLNDLATFQKTLRRSDRLAVEATDNTRWFAAQVKPRVAGFAKKVGVKRNILSVPSRCFHN